MRKALKIAGILVGTLVGLAVLAAVVLALVGRARLNRTYDVPALASLPIAAASPQRGEHVARIEGCLDCHGEAVSGRIFLDIPPGLIVAPNLTPGRGGVATAYEPRDWDRAIRYGVRPDGRWILPFMPYRLYNGLSDADAADLIAWLEALPPVDNDVGATRLRIPGYLMVGTLDPEQILTELQRPRQPAPAPGPTPAYGAYLASVTCVECHGEDLRGGRHPAPEAPPAPGLAHAGGWPLEDFQRALRTGVVPGGRTLTEWMPIRAFRHLTDTEIAALHAHLKALPAPPAAPGAD